MTKQQYDKGSIPMYDALITTKILLIISLKIHGNI